MDCNHSSKAECSKNRSCKVYSDSAWVCYEAYHSGVGVYMFDNDPVDLRIISSCPWYRDPAQGKCMSHKHWIITSEPEPEPVNCICTGWELLNLRSSSCPQHAS